MLDRGINLAAAEKFQLGFTGPTGVDPDGRYKNRLTIPYLSPAGPLTVKYRCIEDHDCKALRHGKYVYDNGAGIYLYNAQTLLKADRVVVLEGEIDTIAVEMCGVPAVGFPGVEMWRQHPYWKWCFDSVNEVVVVADGDPPEKNPRNKGLTPDDPNWASLGVGEEAARAVADSLRKALLHLDVRLIALPVGQDSNSFINTEGQMAFLERIEMI